MTGAVALPVLRHGLCRVEQQVDEHLRQPRVVGQHVRNGLEVAFEPRPVTKLVHHELDRAFHDLARVGRDAALLARTTAEHPELSHDLADPLGTAARILQRIENFAWGSGAGQLAADVVEVAHHVRQGVVDLVADAGAQPSERAQPFGPEQTIASLEQLLGPLVDLAR